VCGITGIVHRDKGHPVSRHDVEVMCSAIRHRGPDDEGLFVQGSVGLGMRRLSIIDLRGGHQPIFNEDRSKVIVFNGEIYNYRDLRRTLLSQGHTFTTQGDTETVVHLYEEHGAECVEKLRGMFAFAIWDANARELLLARDRFGIKPLYVATGPWGIAFASELKALLAAGLTRRELDWEALDMYFQLGYIPAPATPFLDVRKLEPGQTALWRQSGDLVLRRYWDLPSARIPSTAEMEARIVEWLDQSVAAHLVSDVPVAAFLSGGLDSSAVVSSMALLQARPHAFTARYFGSGAEAMDETKLAGELAARYDVELTVVDVRPDIRELLEPIVYALDEPLADDSSLPTWLLSQAVGGSYKVALSGIGGDELFGGYPRHVGMLLGQYYSRLPVSVQRAASAVAQLIREPRDAALGVSRLKRFFQSGESTIPERFIGYLSKVRNGDRSALYHAGLRDCITGTAASRLFQRLYRQGGSPRGLAASLYLDYKTFLADDVLALSDRLAMAHSLEVRVPLVDHEFVEQLFCLPDRVKIGLWQSKHLWKRALRRRLPKAHLHAPKRGFVGPTAAWLRHELRPILLDELSMGRLERLGYFDSAAVTRLLDDHFSRRHNREGILWALLCFSTWHRQYVEAPGGIPAHAW